MQDILAGGMEAHAQYGTYVVLRATLLGALSGVCLVCGVSGVAARRSSGARLASRQVQCAMRFVQKGHRLTTTHCSIPIYAMGFFWYVCRWTVQFSN